MDHGNLAISDSFVTHIDRCLGCLACQTACPSGVDYGRIVERARAEIEHNYRRPFISRLMRRYIYRTLLKNYRVLAFWARLLRLYQRSGLQALVRATGLLRLLGLKNTEALAPRIETRFSFEDLGQTYPAEGAERARVALLVGCVASVSFAELNRATIRVLQKNGVTVHIPAQQGCCGALHAHAGFRDDARELARKNIDAMLSPEIDAVVTNAAGCGSALKEYHDLLANDPDYSARAHDFVAKTEDITEFLAELGLREPMRKVRARVTYQDPCHLAHAQKIRNAPRQLLAHIGVDVVEMAHSDHCCGSAGTYNVVQNELSMKILAAKMDDVSATDVEIIATANVGCMLQLRSGVVQRDMNCRVVHVIELLDEAYR